MRDYLFLVYDKGGKVKYSIAMPDPNIIRATMYFTVNTPYNIEIDFSDNSIFEYRGTERKSKDEVGVSLDRRNHLKKELIFILKLFLDERDVVTRPPPYDKSVSTEDIYTKLEDVVKKLDKEQRKE